MCHLVATRDLAKHYECKNGTKDINKAVSRNKEKLTEDFCFKITKHEYEEYLRLQNGTLKTAWAHHRKNLPYVLTEYGISMLA